MKYISIIILIIICIGITGCNKKRDYAVIDLNREMFIIAKDGGILREEPSISSGKSGNLPYRFKGPVLKRTAVRDTINDDSDYWYYIETGGAKGWIFGRDIDEYDPGIYVINKNGIGPARLGMSFDKFLSYFKYDRIEKNKYGFEFIYRDDKIILSLSDKNYGASRKVKWIIISHPKFKTENGLYTGLPIQQLAGIYPDFKMEVYRMNRFCFAPRDLQTFSKYNKRYVVFLLDFQIDNPAENIKKNPVITLSDNLKGKVSNISIYFFH